MHGKTLKIEKSNLFIYFSLFFSMLKFFSCRSNKFFPGSFGRKRIGSGTLWNFSWPAATRNSKIGFPRQFFLPYEPVKNFSHGKKKFSHWQKRKINEQSTIAGDNYIFYTSVADQEPLNTSGNQRFLGRHTGDY